MHKRYLAKMIGMMFRAPDDGKGGTGGTGTQPPAVKPEDARAFVSEFVSDPESVKAMKDEDVVKFHGKLSTTLNKHVTTLTEKQKAANLEAAKALKLELPKDSKLHATDAERTLAYAREHGLTAEHAASILKHQDEAVAGHVARQEQEIKDQGKKWIETVTKDPELGGDKLVETQRLSQLAIDKLMPQALRDILRTSGLGDHPEVYRFLVNVGKTLKEDSPPLGGSGGAGNVSAADKLYGGTAAS